MAIDLPVADKPLEQARILVVDDALENVTLLARILKQAGYTNVTTTTASSEVLALVARTTPDLVVMDLHMPDPDGFELLHLLGAGRDESWFQVLVLTADDSPAIKERALASGAADFLTKPFNRVEALLRIRNLLKVEMLELELRSQAHELEKRVYERTAELSNARMEILERLAIAAEFRDDATGEHAQRVGRTAALVGGGLGFSSEQIDLIRHAAPLHDIGKIGVPDGILLKPGSLDSEELAQMRQHTTMGASILSGSGSPVLRLGEEIALSHHECWDGSGYPLGLEGEAIPRSGQVVAIADVFDALTHDRPYKSAWPVAEALSEIEHQRGRQFDPRVIDAFGKLDFEALLAPIEPDPLDRVQREAQLSAARAAF